MRAAATLFGIGTTASWTVLLLGVFVGADSRSSDSLPERPPNIVYIISDDHGYPYFGFMGSPIVKTPNLDALAREGMLFTHGYSTSSGCRPALASLLTGLHPLQFRARLLALGHSDALVNQRVQVDEFDTLPGLLAARGYRSFEGGKFWELHYENAGFTDGMSDGTLATMEGKKPLKLASGGKGLALGRETMQPLWDFLANQGERAFFVWFAPMLPHVPHDAPASFEEPYAGYDLTSFARKYYANITRFDAVVGELMATLDRLGLRGNTLIVFLSDNGWEQPSQIANSLSGGPKGKGSIYELGFRTPIIFSWPGRIPAGVIRNELVSIVDVFPTVLEFAGVPARTGWPGRSLVPLLTGDGSFGREFVCGSLDASARGPRSRPKNDGQFFCRDAQWRYIWRRDERRSELYDLLEDPLENHNLIAHRPEVAARQHARLLAWIRENERPPDPAAAR